jgi:molybdate-binding protein
VVRYREICVGLARRVAGGELAPGTALPGVRELAREWGTTATTVSRAQRELAGHGVLELADRRRARVAPGADVAARAFLHGGGRFVLAGSDDPALDLLLHAAGPRVTTVPAGGSSAGLVAVRGGRADGAAIHLLHHSGAYNAPFAAALLRGLDPHLVHLWRREQGVLVPPGNPAGVRGAADLARLRLAVRRPGTGTRVLQDRLLRAAGHDADAVRGPEVGSHLEVALAVATGAVDAGLGVRSAAADLDLDFVHVTWESYDLALPGRSLDAAAPLVAALHDPAVRAAVEALGGYDTARAGAVTPAAPPSS